jgi:hypothetical protein
MGSPIGYSGHFLKSIKPLFSYFLQYHLRAW